MLQVGFIFNNIDFIFSIKVMIQLMLMWQLVYIVNQVINMLYFNFYVLVYVFIIYYLFICFNYVIFMIIFFLEEDMSGLVFNFFWYIFKVSCICLLCVNVILYLNVYVDFCFNVLLY